jgi:hypothetical protein
LAVRFDMSLPAVSKHIRVLERTGLARVTRDGRARRTTLVAAPMREAGDWIERYRRFWDFQFDQLAAYLESASGHLRPNIESTGGPHDKETSAWPRPPRPRAKGSKSDARSRRRGSASSTRGRSPVS